MLTSLMHRIAASPVMYDLIQRLAGRGVVHEALRKHIASMPGGSLILDSGGGTGATRKLWPLQSTHICLDLDLAKLSGLARNSVDSWGLQGDATKLPFKDGCFDVVTCIAVSHHIPDDRLPFLFEEAMRVLKTGGSFVFLDAVWDTGRVAGRLLWKYDRGSCPRGPAQLRTALAEHGRITTWEEFCVFHRYVLCIVRH